jgi:hypothetical protein
MKGGLKKQGWWLLYNNPTETKISNQAAVIAAQRNNKMIGILNAIQKMKSSKVSNYVIAGLDSYLLENGKVRVFENGRDHQDQITPHSNRYDFTAIVLQGEVTNHIWHDSSPTRGDLFMTSKLTYNGEIGDHKVTQICSDYYRKESHTYTSGQMYSMTADQIHSITFGRNSVVLMFEGPELANGSIIIEPFVDGLVIPTYKKSDYMFLAD